MSETVILSVDGVLREYDPMKVMAVDAQANDVVSEFPAFSHWMVVSKRRSGRIVYIEDRLGREHLYNARTLIAVLRPREDA